jgi:hypothetical protein
MLVMQHRNEYGEDELWMMMNLLELMPWMKSG